MQVMQVALPADASCEDFEDEMPALRSLSFLNHYVQDALQAGAAPYIPEEQRLEMGVVRPTVLSEPLDTGECGPSGIIFPCMVLFWRCLSILRAVLL